MSSNATRWLRWDEAARAYEALGRRNPDTLLFRGTKWEITVADVALYCWIAYYARIGE